MTMMRWDPFREMMSLRQAMDRLFEDSFVRPSRAWPELSVGDVPVDMYQTANDVVIKASLPGVEPDEIDISITEGMVNIKGEHKEETEVKEDNYFRKEHRYGSFSRTVAIPVAVKTDKAEAVFDKGMLTLTLPKSEKEKPKQIKVKPKAMIEGAKAKQVKPKAKKAPAKKGAAKK
jgi:HSP20 family protein